MTPILVIDDNTSIIEDFGRVLCPPVSDPDLSALALEVLGESAPRTEAPTFEVFGAAQGEAGLKEIINAKQSGRPFPLAFVDVRMPPGWDGIETAKRIWEADPAIQLVICTAYSDYSWEEMVRALGCRDRLLVLKKPFDDIEVRQLAVALTRKWVLEREREQRMSDLAEMVAIRTQELRASNANLKEQIAKREGVESKLRQAQKLEALGRLMAGLSHEINNPLTFVIANVELAQDGLASVAKAVPAKTLTELNDCLSDIHTGANRIQRLISDVTLFARAKHPGAGHSDVREVVEFAVKIASHQSGKIAQIQTDIAEGLPKVAAPAARLEQVFINLVQNSLQAFETESPENKILISAEINEDHRIAIRVVDNGCGISEVDQMRIFDPFFTTKRFGRGTGLGLSICHGVIESLGGKIAIESTLGAGTTAEILLPSAENSPAIEVKQEAPQKIASNDSVPADKGQRSRILAVDDEPGLLRAIRRALGKEDLTTCRDAKAALDLATEHAFDVILIDTQVPGMDSVSFLDDLAKKRPGAETRVIFMTGGLANDDAKLRLERTRRPCLMKPFTVEQLRNTVAQAVERSSEGSGGR